MSDTINHKLRSVTPVEGIMYCQTHDDFAIEGYDWSEVCHEAYLVDNGDLLREYAEPCNLVPMFVEREVKCISCGVTLDSTIDPAITTLGARCVECFTGRKHSSSFLRACR